MKLTLKQNLKICIFGQLLLLVSVIIHTIKQTKYLIIISIKINTWTVTLLAYIMTIHVKYLLMNYKFKQI